MFVRGLRISSSFSQATEQQFLISSLPVLVQHRHSSKQLFSSSASSFLQARNSTAVKHLSTTAPNMSLAPKFSGARKVFGGTAAPVATAIVNLHTIEIFLDFACPFSAKMYKTLHKEIYPHLNNHPLPIQFIFRHQIQPWHPSSTLLHEASLAVLRLAPQKFDDFSAALFEHQTEYFDVSVVNETRNATYRRLAKLASTSVGVDEEEVYNLLKISETPAEDGSLNTGNAVTDDVKVIVKTARLVGVHVSPTVIFDGVVRGEFSSGWDKKKWLGWLEENANSN